MEKQTLNPLTRVGEKEGAESSEYSTQDLFSSSNFTMSSSEGGEEIEPSTSGCSSFVAHSQNAKEKKKRVKEYLKELKSMVPARPGEEGRMGTLGALQHVLSRLKKAKNGKQKSKGRHAIMTQELSPFEYESDSQLSVSADSLKSSDEMRIILSTQDLLVLSVSSNLKYILGYPEDSWIDRNISHFIHKRDIVTFSSVHHETNYAGKQDSSQSKVFYFRLRKFKGLGSSGFSLRRQDSFVPFQCILIKKMLDKTDMQKEIDYTSSSEGTTSTTSQSDTSASHTDTTCKSKEQAQPISPKSLVKKLCTVIHCVPLVSLYKGNGKLPHVRTFEMRHTLFCSYCYVQPNMITLLGYLPQEVLGASIFDFYHPDDLETLFNIYKKLISMQEKDTPCKGSPIRLRAKNGDWVKVISDWSSFVNPWSKQLEFILVKHTVIEAPENPDLFTESHDIQTLEDLPDSVIEGHQRIKDLLLQPVETTYVGNKECVMPTNARQTHTQNDIEDNAMAVKDCPIAAEPIEMQSKSEKMMFKSQIENVATGLLYKDSSINNQYEQLNYSNGIKKFLLSQPRTFSSESPTKISSSEEEDQKEDETMVSDFDFEISVPKPPSFGSSTKIDWLRQGSRSGFKKVLVSEQEREDGFTNPPTTSVDSQFDPPPLHKEPIPLVPPLVPHPAAAAAAPAAAVTPIASQETTEVQPPVSRPPACPEQVVSLTRESLWKHTLLQERLYIANSSPERGLLFLDKPQEHSSQRQKLKRSHQESKSGWDSSSGLKSRRVLENSPTNPVSMLNPSLPMSRTIDGHFSLMRSQQQDVPMVCTMSHSGDYNVMAPIQMVPFLSFGQAGVPMTSASTTASEGGPNMTSQAGNANVPWQYFPVTSGPLNSQMVVGFNQAGILQAVQPDGTWVPISLQDLNSLQGMQQGPNIVSLPGIGRAKQDQEDKKSDSHSKCTNSLSNQSSMEETSSSLYFLETGSNTVMEINNADLHNLTNQLYGKTWVRPAPWLRNCCFTGAVEMRYHLPKVKRQMQLKKDSEEILHLVQPDVVIDQLNELMDSLDINSTQFFDEEADDLIFLEESDAAAANQLPCKCAQVNNCNLWQSHDHGISRAIPKLRQNLKKEKRKSVASASKQSDYSRVMEDDSDSCFMPGSRKWEDLQRLSSENGSQKQDSSNEDNERPASLNSTLTPSDQRSNNENGSSMKESDGDAMSKQSDSSKENTASSESESETKGTNCESSFEKLFVTLNICFSHLHRELSPWLNNADFNDKVAFTYRKLDGDAEQILKSDMCRLKEYSQPNMVETQLKTLFEEIDASDKRKFSKGLLEEDFLSEEEEEELEDGLAGDSPGGKNVQPCAMQVKRGERASLMDSGQSTSDMFAKLFCDSI